jgi:NAD(P)-dependent dehydrogenase (short-subunit alcohol dehydrogenase family)
VTQAFVKPLVANFPNVKFDSPTQSYASIVNFSSAAGRFGGPLYSHYGTTKAGVEGFSKCVAKEYGSFRIRCNAIMPFFIETPMIDGLTGERRAFYAERVALKRLGKAEEVAQLIYFLASDSSSYITGTGIDINGGL